DRLSDTRISGQLINIQRDKGGAARSFGGDRGGRGGFGGRGRGRDRDDRGGRGFGGRGGRDRDWRD
ncbi:hypothetical protein, partial [Corynebacterium sanguinis]